MGRELRIERIARGGDARGAREVGHVRIGLARIHGISREALHLRALHLGVPVRALHEAQRDAAMLAARELREPVDHEGRALLVGLHREAEALPAGERGRGEDALEDVERQIEALGLLGIERHADVAAARPSGERLHARHELGEHAGALRELVAGMQRRELDGNAGAREGAAGPGGARMRGDRVDRALVGGRITLGIGRGERRLAEHVERVAIGGLGCVARALERFLDGAPHHELLGHEPHALAQRDAHHGLARARREPRHPRAGIARGLVVEAHEPSGQHHSPRPGVEEERAIAPDVPLPVALGKLVADQLVGCGRVGNAQQRFGDAHEEHAFLRREVVFAKERLHAGVRALARAHRFDERTRAHPDARRGFGGKARRGEELADGFGFVAEVMRADPGAQRRNGLVHAASLRGRARLLTGAGLALGDLLAHGVHVERLGLLDHLLERALRQRTGLREDDDLVAEHHQRRDRADLEMPRDLLLLVGVHFGEHDVGIGLGDALEYRCEAPARPAPRRPEVDEDGRVVEDGFLEVVLGDLDDSHLCLQ